VIGRWRSVLMVAFVAMLVGGSVAVVSNWRTAAAADLKSWPLSVAVVGDSMTAGAANRVVWPTLLAQRTGWAVGNFALPDAGFVADGIGGHAFRYQVERAEQMHPQIFVLFAGGVGDAAYGWTGAIGAAVADSIDKIKRTGQRIFVVGPTWYGPNVPIAISAVSDEIQKAAEKAGVPFLNALKPPWLNPSLMQPNLSGPNDKGQSVIADNVAAWLRAEVIAS